jgi:penicillin-binding protein 1A
MVLTTLVADGMNPDTTYYTSAPFHYQPDPYTQCPTGCWDVTTYDNTYLGSTSVTNATVHSDNTVYAQMILDAGPENVAKMAYKLGVRTSLKVHGAYVPSMALGSVVVSPLDMASAYSTLAAGGIYSQPMAIRKVVLAGGKVDTDAGWGKPHRKRVIPDWVAATVTKVLEANMQYGTGVGAYFGRPSAGKTGTTENYADAWFCGFTPNLEATVWIGYPKGEIPMTDVHGTIVSGPSFPATIWKGFMESALGDSTPVDFPQLSGYPPFKPLEHTQYAHNYVPPVYTPPPAGGGETTAASTAGSTSAHTSPAATTAQQGHTSPPPAVSVKTPPPPPATTPPPTFEPPPTVEPPPTTEPPPTEPPPTTNP